MMEPILRMQGITKIYGNGILANDKVDFSINAGEIHALMGENGAGKSTLMKILFGLEKPEEGQITLRGQKVSINSPIDALKLGIGMVHQHFMLVPSLTVAENMVLRDEPRRGIFINMDKAIRITEETASKYNLPIDPRAKISDLPVGLKQRVEILKALYRNAQILILDEPTAVITPQESKELFRQLKNLRDMGHTVVFISHKINEIKELCDRITIMRQGKSVGSYNVEDLNVEDISSLMVGRKIGLRIKKLAAEPGKPVLKVNDLIYGLSANRLQLNRVSFSVREGEILGIAGVEGNGQRELIEIITGLRRAEKGSVFLGSTELTRKSVGEIRRCGVSHIPQDRLTYGTAINSTIAENLISDCSGAKQFRSGILFRSKKIAAYAQDLIRRFQVKCESENTPVGMLSGGNMQKVVVARELRQKAKLVIADQPTRGIDVGTAELIHKRLVELRDERAAILLNSADLSEVLALSDSIIVMYNGEIVAYLQDVPSLSETQLGRYMLGIEKQTPDQIREVCYDE